MRPLSHRLTDGRCRECGQHDSYSAPDTCTRCAVDRMRDREYEIIYNPIAQLVHVNDEMWRQVAQGIQNGSVKAGRFYVFVGHNDGGSLVSPLGDLSPSEWEVPTATHARAAARTLASRYPQVWVVTTVGCWNATRKGQ